MTRIAVFASGNGSNLQVLLDHVATDKLGGGRVELVVSDKPSAYATLRAKTAGVATLALDPKSFSDKSTYETAVLAELKKHQIEWIVLAGYMRLVGPTLLEAYRGKIINLHPSLLPMFPGKDAIGQAWEAGVKYTGVTVHMVDEGLDTGPIIAQHTVRIDESDTLELLTEKIRAAEHELLPQVIGDLIRGT